MPNKVVVGWRAYDYYQWLLEKVRGYAEPYYNYSLLLSELHKIEFTWTLKMDANRASDGERLRWEYMDEMLIPDLFYSEGIKCSVLEMLIALSQRCSSEIMWDGEDTTYKWFWMMIDNLDLMQYSDDNYNNAKVHYQVETWLNRVFKRDGNGSPFPLKTKRRDQRKVDIWFQMCGYLSENYV